jgi:hypothetical protein
LISGCSSPSEISIEDLGDALRVKASAACVYNLFGVRMMKYRHEREGRTLF